MYYVTEAERTFDEVSKDIEKQIEKIGFKVLDILDLGNVLRNKGMDFKENCRVFSVCNPILSLQVLLINMETSMALPCRISVFTEEGITKIGMAKPTRLLEEISKDLKLNETAHAVEEKMMQIIEDSK